MLFNSSPDLYGTIEDIIAEGDKVWVLGEYLSFCPFYKGIPEKKPKITNVLFIAAINDDNTRIMKPIFLIFSGNVK